MEPRKLAACIQQRREEALLGLFGSHRIHQQAHLDPSTGAFGQRIAQGSAGAVRAIDVVLEVDVVAGFGDGFQQGRELAAAVDQQAHLLRGGRRQPGGGMGQRA